MVTFVLNDTIYEEFDKILFGRREHCKYVSLKSNLLHSTKWVSDWVSEWVNEWMSEWCIRKDPTKYPMFYIGLGAVAASELDKVFSGYQQRDSPRRLYQVPCSRSSSVPPCEYRDETLKEVISLHCLFSALILRFTSVLLEAMESK
jgi:hypothetical protein